MHLGVDAACLPPGTECHHILLEEWAKMEDAHGAWGAPRLLCAAPLFARRCFGCCSPPPPLPARHCRRPHPPPHPTHTHPHAHPSPHFNPPPPPPPPATTHRHQAGTLFASMPSLLDPSLAPAGRHVVHAFTPDYIDNWKVRGFGGI